MITANLLYDVGQDGEARNDIQRLGRCGPGSSDSSTDDAKSPINRPVALMIHLLLMRESAEGDTGVEALVQR